MAHGQTRFRSVEDLVLDTAGLRRVDREAQERGMDGSALMESAASVIWHALLRLSADLAPESDRADRRNRAAGSGDPWSQTDYRASDNETRVLILAGPGNNGGDGLALARYAAASGWGVKLIRSSKEYASLPAQQARLLAPLPVEQLPADDPRLPELYANCDFFVDAFLGSGQVGPPRPWAQPILDRFRLLQDQASSPASNPLRVAIDCPSGIGGGSATALAADVCLCIGALNRDLLEPEIRPICGHIQVLPIGFPVDLLMKYALGSQIRISSEPLFPAGTESDGFSGLTQKELAEAEGQEAANSSQVSTALPDTRNNAPSNTTPPGIDNYMHSPTAFEPKQDLFLYKKTRGIVGVVGGSRAYPGAPILAARAAQATGAGYVYLCHGTGVASDNERPGGYGTAASQEGVHGAGADPTSAHGAGAQSDASPPSTIRLGAHETDADSGAARRLETAESQENAHGAATSTETAASQASTQIFYQYPEFVPLEPGGELPSGLGALLVGPGWDASAPNPSMLDWLGLATGRNREDTKQQASGQPLLVFDGGALGAELAGILISRAEESHKTTQQPSQLNPQIVLTPHIGEFRRLLAASGKAAELPMLQAAADFAKEAACWVLLKGAASHIAGPDGQWHSLDAPNPALGFAGSGDILGGIIAGTAARNPELAVETILVRALRLQAELGFELARQRGWFGAEDFLLALSRRSFYFPEGNNER